MRATWIVAFDFSEHARHALAFAETQLAATGGGRLVVAHVILPDSEGMVDWGDIADHTRVTVSDALMALRGETERYASEDIELVVEVLHGWVADAIAELAASEKATVVVCGSHGRRGFRHFMIGSVAEKIVQRVGCTVTVVKGNVTRA